MRNCLFLIPDVQECSPSPQELLWAIHVKRAKLSTHFNK